MTRGKYMYAPKALVDEIDAIKKSKMLKKEGDAKKELVNYAKIGRQVESIWNFGLPFDPFSKRRKRR